MDRWFALMAGQQSIEGKISRRTLTKAALLALAAAGLRAPESTLAYGWPRPLKLGDRGDDVRELQTRIAGWAADKEQQTYVVTDGVFGPGTQAALQRFQRAYNLEPDGRAGPQVQRVLNSLESADGSTAHFDFAEFFSKDGSHFNGGKVSPETVKANVRRNMYKLEALRRKAGAPVSITSGFRSIKYNATLRHLGAAPNSQHLYGIAADIQVGGKTPAQVAAIARTCGYSGIRIYETFTHVDSRIEHDYEAKSFHWPGWTPPRR